MAKRLRPADPLLWLLLVGFGFAFLWVLPLSRLQSQRLGNARTSSYNDWICGQSSTQPRLVVNAAVSAEYLPCLSLTLCPSRSGFAQDIAAQTKQAEAEVQRIQIQLELFDNNSAVTSAYSQKHAVQVNSLGAQLTTSRMLDSLPSQNMSKPTPFLFVGVLSVAANAGKAAMSALSLMPYSHGCQQAKSASCSLA